MRRQTNSGNFSNIKIIRQYTTTKHGVNFKLEVNFYMMCKYFTAIKITNLHKAEFSKSFSLTGQACETVFEVKSLPTILLAECPAKIGTISNFGCKKFNRFFFVVNCLEETQFKENKSFGQQNRTMYQFQLLLICVWSNSKFLQ